MGRRRFGPSPVPVHARSRRHAACRAISGVLKIAEPGQPVPWVRIPHRLRSPAIGVPIDSVGRAGGTEYAPAAVREHGLLERLGARDRGDLDVRIRGDGPRRRDRDRRRGRRARGHRPPSGPRCASRVAAGERPLVLGGCCGLVPGALAGAARRGRAGRRRLRRRPRRRLRRPHVADRRGRRHADGGRVRLRPATVGGGRRRAERRAGARRRARRARPRGGRRHRAAARRRAGRARGPRPLAAARCRPPRERRSAPPSTLGRFWIHLDVDVLDEAAMPATDYLMPGGLEWDELAELLGPLCAAPGLAGLSLGCLNPEKDPGGRCTERTCDLLAARSARPASPRATRPPPARARGRCGAPRRTRGS